MKPVLQSTKKCNETEIKMEKKKANEWMYVNHRKPQLMIEKKPQTKDKRMLYWLYPPPDQVIHNQ